MALSPQPYAVLNNGLKIPRLGLGTWQAPKGEVGAAVKAALEMGYRHIDGAAVYGNEEEIGAVYQEVFGQGKIKREEVWITSKLWNTCHSPAHVRNACLKTLKDLRLSYLDLYLVHWPFAFSFSGYDLEDEAPRDEEGSVKFEKVTLADTWREMEKLVEEGLVRSVGVSNFSLTQIVNLLATARIPPAVNQIEVNPKFTREDLISFCNSKGIHVTAYSAFGSAGSPLFSLPEIQKISKTHSKSPAQILVRWAMQLSLSVIPKSTKPDRIKENANVLDFSLSSQEVDAISGLNANASSLFLKYDWGFDPLA